MLTKLKDKFQFFTLTGAKLAHRMGLTPNQVSLMGLLLAILSGLAYGNWHSHPLLSTLAPFLLLASGLCDALDGALARFYKKATVFGEFFDSLLDRYADTVILCGIILGGLCDLLWGLTTLIGSLLVSYTRAKGELAGVQMAGVGIAERAERLVILAIASFLALVWIEAIGWAIVILAFLTNITVLQRVNSVISGST